MNKLLLMLALTLAACAALAGGADVEDVRIKAHDGNRFDFDVTVRSNDRGWSYYADAFEVLAPDGRLLGRRVLLHPHENEQPFTRDLYGIVIPPGINQVTVRARHNPRGYDGKTLVVPLPR